MKYLKTLITMEGKPLYRVSRWIKVQRAYDVTPRHALYDFATDECGRHPGESGFNPANGVYLDYFRYDGRKWALEQFIAMNGIWASPVMFEENGAICYLSGYDSANYFNPLMIEISEGGEYVRCYED